MKPILVPFHCCSGWPQSTGWILPALKANPHPRAPIPVHPGPMDHCQLLSRYHEPLLKPKLEELVQSLPTGPPQLTLLRPHNSKVIYYQCRPSPSLL
jgi:hypothetical protein